MLSIFRRKAPTTTPATNAAPDAQGRPLARAMTADGQLTITREAPVHAVPARLQAHRLADAFPLIEGAEFDGLVASVKRDGLLEKIVMTGNLILDGRNRYRALLAAGIELRPEHFEEFASDDEAEMARFVASRNINRRHLTEAQRALIAAQLTDASGMTVNDASERMAVSPKSTRRARFVLRHANSNVVQLIRQGELSIHAAHEQARQRPTKASADRVLGKAFDAISKALASGEPISAEMRGRAASVASMLMLL